MLDLICIIFGIGNIPAPDVDGGSGSGDTGGGFAGGGQPGTPTGSSGDVAAAIPFGENGGVVAITYLLFVPVQDVTTGRCYIGTYDINSFDDPKDDFSYSYRKEDIVKGVVVTVSRIWLTIRDIGKAKLTVTLAGTDYNQKKVTKSVTLAIGTASASSELLTYPVDISLSCYRPQITLSRKAGDGPVAVTEVTMVGEAPDA